MTQENEHPVLIVANKEQVIIHVGDPTGFDSNEMVGYALAGYTMTTITIEAYREIDVRVYQTKLLVNFQTTTNDKG